MWKVLEEETIFSTSFFKFRKEKCQLPDKRVMPAYYIMDFSEWVLTVALDKNKNLIMVEQYRHAAKATSLEFPGGGASGNDHDVKESGLRELLEETGYKPNRVEYIGAFSPNPALQSNKMHVYWAEDCEKVAEQKLDPYEDLKIVTVPVNKLIEQVEAGKISHGLMLAAYSLVYPKLKALL